MASASVLVLGSVPAMAKTDETKTESGEEAEASEEKDTDAAKADTLEDGVLYSRVWYRQQHVSCK